MSRARNAIELIITLNQNRDFINAVFESNHRQMNINSVLGLIDYETIEELEAHGFLDLYNNEVLLSDNLVKFLESFLIDSYDEELYDYFTLFKKISQSVELYYSSIKSAGDTQKHLRNIHRYLRRMPSNLLDSLKSMQHHVEFTYRSAATAKEKLQELKGYSEMLDQFYRTLDFISIELKKHMGFFSYVNDSAIDLQRVRLGDYILRMRDTLIKTTQTVLDYIRDTEKSIKFHKHIVELKELRDRKEIKDKTNMYELIFNNTKDPLLSGFTVVEKKNTLIKLYPEYAWEDEFKQRILQRKNEIPDIGKIEPSSLPIDMDFLRDDETIIINYSGILYDYLDKKYNGQSFLTFLREKEPELTPEELFAAYMETIISNAGELIFSEPYEQISEYDCISAYPAYATKNYTLGDK